MARPPAGPIGNSPRDLRDDFVGEGAEPARGGKIPRWPPKPVRVTKNDFHAKVGGSSSRKRADRGPTFRKGHFMRRGR